MTSLYIYKNLPMLKRVLLLLTVFCLNEAYTQDLVVAKLRSETSRNIKKDTDTTNWNWKHGGLYNLNVSQSSLHSHNFLHRNAFGIPPT